MLHQLAKLKVQEAFLNKSEFKIQFKYRSYCPKAKSCGFVRYSDCYTSIVKVFNLKDFYDSCEQEVKYDKINRRSDLKIFSSKDPNRLPIYIEFYVTHASDDSKLHNGGRIIEVKIESEKDIEDIVKNGFIESSGYSKSNGVFNGVSKINNITFWNFKAEDYNNIRIYNEIEFSRYILYPSGKSQCYQDASNCRNLVKARTQSLLEICFHTSVAFGIYEMAKYQGYKRFGIKNCLYCRNYVNNFNDSGKLCRLYKYLGINKYEQHDTSRAKECSHFTLNNDEMNVEIARFNSLNPIEYSILLE